MKKTDTPQNQLKNLPDWQSQVIWTIFKGAMAIFLKKLILGKIFGGGGGGKPTRIVFF